MKPCLIGSLKYYITMQDIANTLLEYGISSFIPKPGKYRKFNNPGEYVDNCELIPRAERVREEKMCTFAHLEKIENSDIVYVINPDGYVGLNTAVEIFYAYLNKKPVYSLKMMAGRHRLFLLSFIQEVEISPEELAKIVLTQPN